MLMLTAARDLELGDFIQFINPMRVTSIEIEKSGQVTISLCHYSQQGAIAVLTYPSGHYLNMCSDEEARKIIFGDDDANNSKYPVQSDLQVGMRVETFANPTKPALGTIKRIDLKTRQAEVVLDNNYGTACWLSLEIIQPITTPETATGGEGQTV